MEQKKAEEIKKEISRLKEWTNNILDAIQKVAIQKINRGEEPFLPDSIELDLSKLKSQCFVGER